MRLNCATPFPDSCGHPSEESLLVRASARQGTPRKVSRGQQLINSDGQNSDIECDSRHWRGLWRQSRNLRSVGQQNFVNSSTSSFADSLKYQPVKTNFARSSNAKNDILKLRRSKNSWWRSSIGGSFSPLALSFLILILQSRIGSGPKRRSAQSTGRRLSRRTPPRLSSLDPPE